MRLSDEDTQFLNAILRDRAGMDKRIAELSEEIVQRQQELNDLSKRRAAISDSALAEKFSCSKAAIYYHIHGR